MATPGRLVRRARVAAGAGARVLRQPPIGPRVRGVVEQIEAVAEPEVLHPAHEIERRPPGTLGAPHPVFAQLATHRHPAAFRARLQRARVVGAEPLVLTNDHRALLASTFDRVQLDANAVMRRRLPRARVVHGRHALLTNQWALNHFHWMLDTLPRAALLPADLADDVPVIVPRGLHPDQVWSLGQAGIDAARLMPFDGAHLQVDELIFPSFVGGTGNPPRWALDWLRERLVPAPRQGGRRLYVSRADAAWRRVTNEDEIVTMLEGHGFEPILPATLPLEEQLRTFAEAAAIVGPHGAGLVNLLGAAAGTPVVELFDERYVNGCYYALADALDQPYWYVVCAGSGRDGLRADPEAVQRTLAAAGLV